MPLLLSGLAYLPKIFAGFWLAHRLWRDPTPAALRYKLFLGLPLGLGLWSLGYFLWIWAGLNRLIFPWVELSVSLGLTALALPTLKPLAVSWQWRALLEPLNLVLLVSILVSGFLFAAWLYMDPHGHEDAWFIWNLDARFIYLANDFRILYAPNGPGWHPDYPLMVPLNVVSGWVLVGTQTSRVQMAVTSLFSLILPGILYSALALLKSSRQAALATIVLLASPMFLTYGGSQQADIPVAGFIIATLTLLALFFKTNESGLLCLAGLTAGLSAWAKNEGLLFSLTSGLTLGLFLLATGQGRALWKFAAGLLFPLTVVLLYKQFLAPLNDLMTLKTLAQLFELQRYEIIFQSLREHGLNQGWWPGLGLPITLALYGLLAWFEVPNRRVAGLLGLTLLLQLAGYIGIYLLTPHELTWHVDTSFERLLLHLFPTVLFLFFYLIRSPNLNLVEGWKNASDH
jgi:hypothetical protein